MSWDSVLPLLTSLVLHHPVMAALTLLLALFFQRISEARIGGNNGIHLRLGDRHNRGRK
jgi:cobalamin synthase